MNRLKKFLLFGAFFFMALNVSANCLEELNDCYDGYGTDAHCREVDRRCG